jgi:hypothetical protein
VDEVSVSWGQAITPAFRLTATGIWRNWHDCVNAVLVGGEWASATSTLPAWTDSEPNPIAGTTTVPIYRWANPTDAPKFLIQNTDAANYAIDGSTVTAIGDRSYRGLMLVVERRLKNRWQMRGAWVVSKTEDTVTNSAFAGFQGTQFTPNQILTNASGPTGFDRRHQVQVFAGWQVPKSQTKWTGSLNVNVLPRGTLWTDSLSQASLRVEKVAKHGVHRFGLYADIENLFNQGTGTVENGRYPSVQLTDYQRSGPVTAGSFFVWYAELIRKALT